MWRFPPYHHTVAHTNALVIPPLYLHLFGREFSVLCIVNCLCKKNNVKFHQNDSTLGNQSPLEVTSTPPFSSILVSCVRWSCPWSNEMYQVSSILCSHKVGSKYLTLSVIVIRRRSPPSSPPLDMMHHVLLVLVLSTCPCWLSSCGFINLWTEGITPRLLDGQQHHYGRHGALFGGGR